MLPPLAMLALIGGFAGLGWLKARAAPRDSAYVGSYRCESCHRDVFAAWSESQHTKMMRPVRDNGVLVADFSMPSSDRRFDLDDVVWAIGGKWEQQFMGHSEEGETLLPGAWLHLSGEWRFRGWDGWQVPVPRKRCHGCHTVGLNAETGTFVETNIGCESCHGPASWHVATWGFGRITSLVDADTCGQCHVRGRDKAGEYFFPATYRPGDALLDHFDPVPPYPGENTSDWWGNGSERDRHQQYLAWGRGGHAHSLQSLRDDYDGRFGPLSDECLSCHAAEAILQPWRKTSIDEAQQGITCSVCHNTHGDLDALRLDCADCHGEGAFYHSPERNLDHVPCPPGAEVGCVSCHMPQTIEIGGDFALHSHSPGIVSPREAATWEMPSSCSNGGCHLEDPPERFDPYFGDVIVRSTDAAQNARLARQGEVR